MKGRGGMKRTKLTEKGRNWNNISWRTKNKIQTKRTKEMDTSKGKRKALKLTISQNFGPPSLLHNRMLNTWTTRACLGKHMTPRDHIFRVWTQWSWGSNSFLFYNVICTVALPYKTLCPFLSHTRMLSRFLKDLQHMSAAGTLGHSKANNPSFTQKIV